MSPQTPVSPSPPPDLSAERIHWSRYRRTLWVAAWLFGRALWWELIVRRVFGERAVARGRAQRLRRWAREFREMAVQMGGVMIKLGQFISIRADVLPAEVIEELAGLQDEVPTVPFAELRATLDEDLGGVEGRCTLFDPVPVAAASLGQAHRARLPGGERVIVKVQRPGIRSLVHTDLRALEVIARWLMRLGFIARRANVPALLAEFSALLWLELDYEHEAQNVELFQRLFAQDKGVYIPGVYRAHSTRRVLTLEDVTAIKITDYAQMEAAGIDRRDVSHRLITAYLWMVFTQRVYHADPHPGNLFVYPLDPGSPAQSGQHADGTPLHGRPFYLIFVDFGMVGHLTPQIEAGLREMLVALTTRDAARLVRSYTRLGVLMPGADLARIEEASRAVFDRVWGMSLSEIAGMSVSEMASLGREFRDLLFSMPFQVPQDFIVLTRAVSILAGLVTEIDPAFDPWHEVAPFARRLAKERGGAEVPPLPLKFTPRDLLNPETLRALLSGQPLEALAKMSLSLAQRGAHIPLMAETVLRRADQGDLVVQAAPSPELKQQIARVERAVRHLAHSVTFAGLMIGSAILYASGETTLGVAAFAVSAIGVGWRVARGG